MVQQCQRWIPSYSNNFPNCATSRDVTNLNPWKRRPAFSTIWEMGHFSWKTECTGKNQNDKSTGVPCSLHYTSGSQVSNMVFKWFVWAIVARTCRQRPGVHPREKQDSKEKAKKTWIKWRRTCFDWLRERPRACSTAAAWGIAALCFFCFGCWKDCL